MTTKNAQAWGMDLFVAVTIFLVGIIFFYLYAINYPSQSEEGFQAALYEAELIADSLMSEGSPSNWNPSNVVRIGLLSDNKINQTKLEDFYQLRYTDYQQIKSLFRIKNDFYVYFQEPIIISGGAAEPFEVEGIGEPAVNQENLARISRLTIYNNNITTLNIYTWN